MQTQATSAKESEQVAALQSALAAERALLAAERERVAELTRERDCLRASHERLRLELELLKRRIFIAKAERVDTAQLELEFAATLAALDRLGGLPPSTGEAKSGKAEEASGGAKGGKKKSTGRRNLFEAALEEERVELTDPLFEKLVAEGKAQRMGHEESCKVAWKRGGLKRLVVARVKYRTVDSQGESCVETTPMPKECFPRSLAAPSALAHIIVDKHCDGLPLFRIEERFTRDGFGIDRGTLSRWLEDAGATVGATVIAAARKEALASAFCIATDATGIAVQPSPAQSERRARQACRKGHYFVLIADRDHIFFEYTPKETSPVIAEMFKGYSGYVQADAKSVYDVLFREPEEEPPDGEEPDIRKEVGCLSHCRRKFWEAALAKCTEGREGLARLCRIFALEATWRGRPPEEILRLRNAHLRPHMEAFFTWAEAEYEKVKGQRGILRSALGYAVRQKAALLRPLEDGRLVLENNRSELQLRKIAVGRKAWLFVGSDDHAHAAGHLFSLIASARLHRLNPEAYLRDLFRVLGHWPDDRYLELAPKHWAATRARLDPAELALEIGPLTVPPPLPTATQQQPAPH
jgi:transposase